MNMTQYFDIKSAQYISWWKLFSVFELIIQQASSILAYDIINAWVIN